MTMRWLALAAGALLLGGCFISDDPLIPSNAYVYPLPAQANGDSYGWDKDTHQWKYRNAAALRRSGDGYVLTENNEDTFFVMMPLAPNAWLVQTGGGNGQRYLYGYLERDDKGAYYSYGLDDLCTQLWAQRDSTGLQFVDDDCQPNSLDDLVALVRNHVMSAHEASAEGAYIIR